MDWQGKKIKEIASTNKFSLTKLASQIGVSRQAVNTWVKGKVPKGNHLIALCNILKVDPNFFFEQSNNSNIAVPVHRVRRKAIITEDVQADAFALAKNYEFLFRNNHNSTIIPVIRAQDRSFDTVKKISTELRNFSGVHKNQPITYKNVFFLLSKLGINVIFRFFPESIKAYAFYTRIYGHRVIIVNYKTNMIDLIFALLHEAVHAVRDEIQTPNAFDKIEEDFCDAVANHVQFPDSYIKSVGNKIKGLKVGLQVKILKSFAKENCHSLFGLQKRLKSLDYGIEYNIGGADTNLRKQFPTVEDLLFNTDDSREFLEKFKVASPLFFETVLSQIEYLTTRKIGEFFDFDDFLDSRDLKDQLLKMREPPI